MSDYSFQFKDQKVDWSSISDEDLNAMYRQSMRSNKTVSEEDEDGNFSHKDYDTRQWKNDQEDNWSKLGMTNVQHLGGGEGTFDRQRNYVHQAYDAVQSEWQNRLDKKFDGLGNQKAAPAPAPVAEAKEEKTEEKPKVELPTTPDPIKSKSFADTESQQTNASWANSEWNPDRSAAKGKVQAVQNQSGSKIDYSFNAGGYGQKSGATYGAAGGSTADAYGNVPASDMDAEHKAEQLKNSHLGKVKNLM